MNKIKTLIPLSEFVSKIDEICPIEVHEMSYDHEGRQLELIKRYNNFLLRPLNIGMFVPADEDGNVIEEPESYGWIQNCGGTDSHLTEDDYDESEKYHEAKSRILFDAFEIEKDMYKFTKREIIWLKKPISKLFLKLTFHNGDIKESFMPDNNINNIEDLLKYDLHITETALKQIYG